MYANTDSQTCLRAGEEGCLTTGFSCLLVVVVVATCMPVGGYSVWGGLRRVDRSQPIVLGVAAMDSTALFHDAAPGADAHTSGAVALLSAAAALARVALT